MAIESDTQATLEVVLSQHRNLPHDKQPRFYFRYMRRRQHKALGRALEKLQKSDHSKSRGLDAFKVFDELEDLLRPYLVDWENQTDENGRPVPFNLDDFDLVVDEIDLAELAVRAYEAQMLSTYDQKKSASRSLSNSVPAAQPASAELDS